MEERTRTEQNGVGSSKVRAGSSITDELREVAAKTECANGRCEKLYRGDLERIADRIDEQHEHAVMSAMNDALYHANDESMAELWWLRLPKDADGVPIRVGDVMEERSGHTFEVASLMAFGGSDNWLVLSDARNFSSFREPHDLRHYHEPTVEDVLRECIANVCKSNAELHGQGCPPLTMEDIDEELDEYINEYAVKLRLAGEAE